MKNMPKFWIDLVLFIVGSLGVIVLLAASVISPVSTSTINGAKGWFAILSYLELMPMLLTFFLMAVYGLISCYKETLKK